MAKNDGFTVCPNLAGHGIGSVFHGPPEILHTGAFFIWDVSQTLIMWYSHIDFKLGIKYLKFVLPLASERDTIMGTKLNRVTQNVYFLSSNPLKVEVNSK